MGNPFEGSPGDPHTPLPGSHTESKALLGLALFWDEQVSSDGTVACATCHIPEVAGVDKRMLQVGPNGGRGSSGVMPQDALLEFIAGTPAAEQRLITPIVAPTVLGAGYAERLLWDVSVPPEFEVGGQVHPKFTENAALEALAVGPPLNDVEMAHGGRTFADVIDRLRNAEVLRLATASTIPSAVQAKIFPGMTYEEYFNEVFTNDPTFGGTLGVTRERFAMAIATYIRTLVPNQAPIDIEPRSNLSQSARNGLTHLRNNGCFNCHSQGHPVFQGGDVQHLANGGFADPMDAMLTDNELHGDLGFPELPGATGKARGDTPVKTPTLRNVLLKQRFTHNGFFDSFDDLLDFYNGDNPDFQPLVGFSPSAGNTSMGGHLDATGKQEVRDFFETLTDPRLVPANHPNGLPMPFSHPDLYADRYPEGSNEPGYLPGTPAAPGGMVPDIIAHVPAIAGHVHFKLGVREASPSSFARLGMSPNPLPATHPGVPLYLSGAGLVGFNTVTDVDGFSTYQEHGVLTSMVGQTLSYQWLVWDASVGAFAYSNAAEWTVQ